jgi:hypothetical protein
MVDDHETMSEAKAVAAGGKYDQEFFLHLAAHLRALILRGSNSATVRTSGAASGGAHHIPKSEVIPRHSHADAPVSLVRSSMTRHILTTLILVTMPISPGRSLATW